MIVFMLSNRNIAGVQFSHKTTEKLIVFSESLSVGQSRQSVHTVPASTGEKATIKGVCCHKTVFPGMRTVRGPETCWRERGAQPLELMVIPGNSLHFFTKFLPAQVAILPATA
jgi:hypothetical protein